MAGVVEGIKPVIEKHIHIARLRDRARWYQFRMLDLDNGTFAFTHFDNDSERHPDRGGYSIEDAERFVRARENESRW